MSNATGDGGARFLVCRPPRAPVAWRPPDPTDETGHDVGYFGSVLAIAAEALGQPPLTFILTWDLDHLPETGDHVVAIVQGDEDGRIPRWADDVLITFKCYGSRPPWVPIRGRPGLTEALELAHFMRRALLWLPGIARRTARLLRTRARPSPIVALPLGYYNQQPRPVIAPSERRWFVSFAGSGFNSDNRRGLRAKIGTPKGRSRAEMLDELERLRRLLPAGTVATIAQADFPSLLPGQDADARQLAGAYSDLLAQSRVCLVPRGNSPETFRFFEALRAGCVVVCEALPNHWFYRGAPVITVRRWRELSDVILPLVRDPDALLDLHRASLHWWQAVCSEEAIGRRVAREIRARQEMLRRAN